MITYKEAIAEATYLVMRHDPKVIVMGVGVTDEKGIFGTTKLAHDSFRGRVWETPLSENMLTGAAWGMALNGYKPILVHARADFLMLTMEHLVNTAAKWSLTHQSRIIPKPTMIVRAIIGKGWGQGPQHSQAFIGMLSQISGITLYAPSTPAQVMQCFDSAMDCGGLAVIIEHRALYDSSNEDLEFSDAEHPTAELVPISGARIESLKAAKILEDIGVPTKVSSPLIPIEFGASSYEPQVMTFIDIEHNGVSVNLANKVNLQCRARRCNTMSTTIVSPPHWPLPTSRVLESEWYPSPDMIVEATLKAIGRTPNSTKVVRRVAHPKDGPF